MQQKHSPVFQMDFGLHVEVVLRAKCAKLIVKRKAGRSNLSHPPFLLAVNVCIVMQNSGESVTEQNVQNYQVVTVSSKRDLFPKEICFDSFFEKILHKTKILKIWFGFSNFRQLTIF